MDYLEGLNDMQRKAVLQTDGAVLMLAGAGSGKTRALTFRIAEMVRIGVNPFNILAITFTNKAAKEMRERVNQLVGDNAKYIFVSTFHSACVRFLRRDIESLDLGYTRSFTIYDTDDQKSVYKDCYRELNIDDRRFKLGAVMSEISSQKDELIGCAQYENLVKGDYFKETIAKIYSLYQSKLKKSNALDFDDIIFLTVKLFKENQYILEAYQERFLYIMVDEYQDTNTAQYVLVKLLASKHGNLCVVGDDDQSIYGWRGANIENIYNFEKDFPSTNVIKLEQNYRSTENILNTANAVIVNNKGRKGKKLWTEKGPGSKIKLVAAENEEEEAIFVVNEIVKTSAGRLKDFAVLYRTNAQSRALEDIFVKKNVPYRIFGGLRFYERKEIKDVLAYLRLIVNNNDDVSARRIVNVPKRGAGKAAVDKISAYADSNGVPFYAAMKELYRSNSNLLSNKLKEFVKTIEDIAKDKDKPEVSLLIERLLSDTGYMSMLEETGDEYESASRIDNVKELISKAVIFETSDAEQKNLQEFLSEVALVADIDNYSEDDDTVSLMTIHSAKGLEFPVVFLTGLEDGLFPSYGSISYGGPKALEEERRLFYVGVTRAERQLYLTRAKRRMTRGLTEYGSPSRFIKEIPEEFTEGKATDQKKHVKIRDEGKRQFVSSMDIKIKTPVKVEIDFKEGDTVIHPKYGQGAVLKISPAGKDYEVTVEFPEAGSKKFMAALSKLKKA